MHTFTKYLLSPFFALVLSLCAIAPSYSQVLNTFMRTFQASAMNGGLALAETSDDGFIGTGQHESSGAGSCDVYVYKVDGCGNPEWFKTYGGPGEDGGKDIQQTSDGGYIVAGLAHLGQGDYDMQLLKLDALGNIQWSKVYGGASADYGLSVHQTSDGGYVMSGFMTGLGFGGEDVAVIKTDANGNTQWMKVYGGAGSDWGDYVEETADGGYKVVGYTTSFGSGGHDIYVLKIDASGNLQWAKTYGGAAGDGSSAWGIAGKVTADGGFMICANTASYGAGSNDYLLIKTDNNGALVWAKTYGGAADDQPRFSIETDDHGFAIFGYTTSFGAGDLDAYLVKTDSMGTLQWSKAYGGGAYDKGSMVREAPDGGFALSIVTASFGATYFDPLFMKTDSIGQAGCNDLNAATIVQTVTPGVGSGGSEMVPSAVIATPTVSVNNFTPNDIYLCQHCNTIPTFVPSDTTVCVGDTVFLYNTTSVGKRCFEGWYVNGTHIPGNIDTLPFVFNSAGIQKIQLIAECGNATDTNTIYIHTFDVPVAAYSKTDECDGSPATFTDGSTIASGAISSWSWDFGDGSPANTIPSPNHLYAAPGQYQAQLIVSNNQGCADSITKTVNIFYNPVAAFSQNNVCLGDSMQFTNTSTIDNSTSITAYTWSFGDGSPTSSSASPSHYYSTQGTYTVTLIATSADACSDTVSSLVHVYDQPSASFTYSNVCLTDSALLINTSSAPSIGSIASFKWSFGDGSPVDSSTLSPKHLYAAPGTYTITLSAYSSNLGCADTATSSITVFPIPVANFGLSDICLSDSASFHDSSGISTGTVFSWIWNFGDGSSAVTQHPKHKYAAAGTYTVTLVAISNNSCRDTVYKTIKVHALPVAQFTVPINTCHGNQTVFNEASTIPASDTIQAWSWNFADGSPLLNQQTVTGGHLYAATGTYNVSLITTSSFGCKDTITKTLFV
ncbi:MAG: PKD domain-containing protein, partial [Bacteroidia bacterium]